ncbi:MAG: hypothetical protein JST26_09635 [Bacteroidetes bacterium]|nr:hypothetical protein [Bacteroidota bacterium]
MTPEELDSLNRHVAGQTIRHRSPFDALVSYHNAEPVTDEFLKKWVAPFYMKLPRANNIFNELAAIKKELTDDVIKQCLGDFNWRTRSTGAFFAAMLGKTEYTDIIGTHLLKSEVVYSGMIYCRVLASFNTPASIAYLESYLDYYLTRHDLFFDQGAAMAALMYLDKTNGTHLLEKHMEAWNSFNASQKSRQTEINLSFFEGTMDAIEKLRNLP